MLSAQDLSENGMTFSANSGRVSFLNAVAGWELDLDTLDFVLDQSHQSMLGVLGEVQPLPQYNLLEYGNSFLAEEDIPLMLEKLEYSRANRNNPDYVDRFELRMKAADGSIYYFLFNSWLVRPGLLRGHIQNITDLKDIKDEFDCSSATVRAMLDSTTDHVFICTHDGTLIFWNSAFESAMRKLFQVELTKGLSLKDTVNDEVYQQWMPLLSSANEGVKKRVELSVSLPEFYHLEVSVNPIQVKEHVPGISFFIRDITQQWKNQTWERLESKVLENAYRSDSLTDVFDLLLMGIQEIAPQMTCYITRKIENKMLLEWVSMPSLPPSFISETSEIPIDATGGSCGLSACTMQPAYVRDIREHSSWERYRDITLLNGFYSCYSFPVISKEGRILGTLGAYFKEPHDATEYELTLWQRAVNLVGLLLEKEEKEREVRRKGNQLDEIAASIPGVLFKIRRDTDGQLEFEYVSNTASKYLGLPAETLRENYISFGGMMGVPDEINETNLFEYYLNAIHPDDREEMSRLISEAVSSSLDFQTEHRIRHFDGHYIWLHCKARCSKDAITGDTLISGIAMDITHNKQSEEDKKRRENLLEAVSLLPMNLVSDEALDEHIQRLLAKIGEAMGLSRINVFRNFQEGEDSELYSAILMDWNAKGIASMKSDPFMQKMNIRKSGFGKWVQSIQQGQLFINNAEDLSVVEKAFFQRYNTTALLAMPVLLNGAWWGMLTFEIGEKEYVWQEEEISVFSAVSNLIGSVIERKRVRDDLVHSERHHRSVIETMAEGLIISDTNGNTLECNPAAEKMLRMSREKILSVNAAELTTQLIRLDGTNFLETECPAYRSIHTGNTITNQVMGLCMVGAPELWLSVNASPLRDPLSGTIVGAVETFTDITDQVHQDRELKRNLAQKEVLLTEVHHRVKNNLAIVSSLLQLQQLYTLDEQMRNMLQSSQGRLRSMSLMHEILYKNGDFSRISFDSYLNEIGEYLKSTFARPHQEILFEISTDECELEITKAIPCGLVVNELVTNAFKYAFADRNEGLIVIYLRRNGDYFILEICDDGPGLPDSFDWKTAKTMGFTLVRTLSDQLKGVLNIENKNGARLVLTFPK